MVVGLNCVSSGLKCATAPICTCRYFCVHQRAILTKNGQGMNESSALLRECVGGYLAIFENVSCVLCV